MPELIPYALRHSNIVRGIRAMPEARKTPLADANFDRQTAFEDEGLPSC